MGSRRSKKLTNDGPIPTAILGRMVRDERKSLKLTQEALALHSGVGLAFLYELEHGKKTVRLDKVLAVLKTLGITMHLRRAQPDQPAGTIQIAVQRPLL